MSKLISFLFFLKNKTSELQALLRDRVKAEPPEVTKKVYAALKLMVSKFDAVTSFVLFTFVLLIILTFLPEVSFHTKPFGVFTLKSVNLTSDIYEAGVVASSATLDNVIDTVTGSPDKKALLSPLLEEKEDPFTVDEIEPEDKVLKDVIAEDKIGQGIRFEDYSETDELTKIANKLRSLKKRNASMRIAFLGDSFIEADIFTADVRNQLQGEYGGRGVGFVPISSIAAKYRNTIEHSSAGWKPYSMMHYKEANWKRLTLPGFYYVPEEGATVSIKQRKTKDKSKNLSCSSAKLLFVNERNVEITVCVNGTDTITHTPPSDTKLQSIPLHGDISSLDFTFANVAGFYGYGVVMNDSSGIYVDNYSVRGSSGIVLSTVDKELSHDFDKILPSDIIVLQYGLNVAAANITNYSYYKKKMVDVVKMLKSYFPHSSIIIMGVGDRAIRMDSGFETMPGIPEMVAVQREIAQEAKCIFWDTFTAMGGRNSMALFVSHTPPLASKDYTHINHAGGKKIARSFVSSMLREVESITLSTASSNASQQQLCPQ